MSATMINRWFFRRHLVLILVNSSALIGHNGAGKTTLLKSICGYLKANSGDVNYKGEAITNISPAINVRNGDLLRPPGEEPFSETFRTREPGIGGLCH